MCNMREEVADAAMTYFKHLAKTDDISPISNKQAAVGPCFILFYITERFVTPTHLYWRVA